MVAYHLQTRPLHALALQVVREAERRLLAAGGNKEYLPISGHPEFCRLSRDLAFGPHCPQTKAGCIATVQSISGTGALRVGAEFLSRHHPGAPVLLPSPTWGNHRNIFGGAGLEVRSYRYYKPETRGLDFEVRRWLWCKIV